MSNYKKVDIVKYVEEGLKNGTLVPRKAEKFARIAARRGVEGEEVISWSVDNEGKEVKEKVDTVKKDEETGKLGMVATKLNDTLDVIVDENGHTNQWIISDSVFQKKYEEMEAGSGIYKPIGGTQVFVQISEDITIFQWDEEMTIAAGGYINITNPGIYMLFQKEILKIHINL